MKNTAKKFLSLLLAAMMIFGAAVAGAGSVDFADIGIKAEAADEYVYGHYTFILDANGNATIKDVNSAISGDIIVPSRFEAYPIVAIGAAAFSGCNNITSLELPEGIYEIGDSAFAFCSSMTDIIIPDSVTDIGIGSFQLCTSLQSVTLPKGVTVIPESAFQSCRSLKNVYIKSNDLDSVGDRAFYDCVKLERVETPMILGSAYFSIGDYAFAGCESLTYCFYGFPILPQTIIKIGDYAFYCCKSIEMIGICQSSLGEYVFSGCDSLKQIIVDSTNKMFCADAYGVLYNKNQTTLVQYPIGNTRNEFEIPNTVKVIESQAFTSCQYLEKITIPDTVIQIHTQAFGYCDNLTDVYYEGSREEWEAMVIDEGNESLTNAVIHYDYHGPVEYVVIWNVDYDTDTQTYKEGETIVPPEDPIKDGYIFIGWDKEIPEKMPPENLTFTAVFEKNIPDLYTVTWVVDGAKTTHSYEVGAKITPPANPTKSGYTFKGWTPSVPSTMPAKNLTFTAVFEKIVEKNIYNLGEETYSFDNFGDNHSPGGHCFGMAVTSSGYYTENLDITEIGLKSSDKLYTASESEKTKTPICYYHGIQGPGAERNSMVAGGNIDLYGKVKTDSDWNECVNYVKNHQYDNKGNLNIGMWFKGSGGHAVNFLYYKNVGGQDRIYAYDNNYPKIETYYYMGSDGYIHQGTDSSSYIYQVSIIGIDLMDVNNYFKLAKDFKHHKYIYADFGDVSVSSSKMYYMKSGINSSESVMYEIENNSAQVTIVPNEKNSTFTYLGKQYRFINKEAGTFNLANSKNGVVTHSKNIEVVETELVFAIRTPSTTEISYGDSIILHAEVENLPKGGKIVWSADNSNFTYTVSDDGSTCTISPSASGTTTFTATVVDTSGEEISSDSQMMTSNAGFFRKIIAFFKKLFGLTKVIPEVFKDIT